MGMIVLFLVIGNCMLLKLVEVLLVIVFKIVEILVEVGFFKGVF